MTEFDRDDPFPLQDFSYADAQMHSAAVDAFLDLRCDEVEAKIHWGDTKPDQNLWRDLPPKTLLTPYTEFRQILNELQPKPNETVIDLGCAYGRCGFVIARHFPGVGFIGYELVGERAEEAQRAFAKFGLPSVIRVEVADLADPNFKPAPASYYFIYDFGSRQAIAKTLEDLRSIAQTKSIQVIGRGRAIRDAIEQTTPWLANVHQPRHFAHFSIYQS